MRIRVRPQARVDMLEIWHFIARNSIAGANRLTERFDKTIRDLAGMPGMGHVRADVQDPRYRFYSVGNYVIAYRTEGTVLCVVRVAHGARDFRKLFPPPA